MKKTKGVNEKSRVKMERQRAKQIKRYSPTTTRITKRRISTLIEGGDNNEMKIIKFANARGMKMGINEGEMLVM